MIIRLLLQVVFAVLAPLTAIAVSPVAQTGQTTCSNASGTVISCSGTGQDGDIKAGVIWQNPRFTDNDNQTVTDSLTGLIWVKDANPMQSRDVSFDVDGTAGDGAVTWQHAIDYITRLNNESYLGFNDWRLPNVKELESLLNKQEIYQANWLNSQGFINVLTQNQFYWTSTSYALYNTQAWAINMWWGNSVVTHPKSTVNLVWPVRAGSTSTVPSFTDNGDQTITDQSSGLMWSKNASAYQALPAVCSSATGNWQNALDQIVCLNNNSYLGYKDWRLPNVNELSSIVNESQANQGTWLNGKGFSNINASSICWTSTTAANSKSQTWLVSLDSGARYVHVSYAKNVSGFCAWPVRSGQWDAVITSPSSNTFPDTQIATISTTKEFTISNRSNSNSNIKITDISVNGLDSQQFTVAPGGVSACPSLTPSLSSKASCTVQVFFKPTSEGTKSANLHIAYTGEFERTYDAALSGLAITTIPVVKAFSLPSTYANLIVPINSLTATDDTAVTGYCVTESNDSASCVWKNAAPTSYTFSGIPQTIPTTKTLYAFAKDAEGNISAPLSGTVTITLVDTTAPIVNVFTMPTTASSLTVPVTTFTANDNSAVTGYILTETATAPLPSVSGWTSIAPSSYTFSTAGSVTLYAFAKDAAGNISVPVSASITITLADSTAPTITTFVIPATSSSLTVTVTTFTASDNVAVTGYLLSEVSSVPSLTAQDWASTAQGSYTFATLGSKTLYAFAKDAAGNISPSTSDSVEITLPPPAPINGICGGSDGQAQGTAPTIDLCLAGTASPVNGTGPWNWTCSGSNGGTTASCTASIATLPPTQFTVTPATGNGYTINPATPQTVTNNATTSFAVIPLSGYGIASVSGCGGSLSGSSYTTGTITAGCTVIVTSVARTASSGGTSQPTVSDALKALQAVVGITPLNATEQIRYDVAPLSVNGIPLGNGTIDAADVVAILRRSIGIGSW